MDDELRMKLADLGSPEALAACIIEHFPEIQLPVALEPIATAVGIIEIAGQDTDSFEGVLITDAAKSRGSIAYNTASPIQRRRFTIAHELGHFLLPFHGASAQCGEADLGLFTAKDTNRRREAEANRFAAALLMPRTLIQGAIRRLGAPELEHLISLAQEYGVSKEALVRRYVDLCDDPCAVIFSQHGQIVRIYRTSTLPFMSLKLTQPLPRACASRDDHHEVSRVSHSEESEPALWFDDTCRFRAATLYEQFLDQANGYRMTFLTIEGELNDEDDPDAGDDEEDAWAPPRFS